MLGSMAMMFLAVFAKVITGQLIHRMQKVIANVNQERQRVLGELKIAQSQKGVADRNRATLEAKKGKIQKKISRLDKELKEFESDVENRQKVRETMRGKLVRSTSDTGVEAE